MAFGVKTNERPGTRAQVRYVRMSASKARAALDLIRGRHVAEADEVLRFVERDAAIVVRKCLASAVANAAANDEQDPETLFVSACFADEGPTLKRWRPRARGRATRIRKRTCHITIIVSRLPEVELRRRQERQAAAAPTGRARRRGGAVADRRARVARSRQRDEGTATTEETAVPDEPSTPVPGEPTEETLEAAVEADEATDTGVVADDDTAVGDLEADEDDATDQSTADTVRAAAGATVEGVEEVGPSGAGGAEAELAEQDAASDDDLEKDQ